MSDPGRDHLLERRIAELEAQNAAALALHRPDDDFDDFCNSCDYNYPCPTARALGVTE
ncbi:MAG: hypothetical protein LC798_10685 [Chloroflexi bacterium]|nr:hypothetical protein [Chloroflexota bacterium]